MKKKRKKTRADERELARLHFDVVAGYVISQRYVVGECRKKDKGGRQAGE